jgi:hypothetical protein
VICHTKHRTNFAGTQGREWGHNHEEVDIKVGGTIGYVSAGPILVELISQPLI